MLYPTFHLAHVVEGNEDPYPLTTPIHHGR